MLVLTRKIGQKVLIGRGVIQVKILRVERDIISIGFSAPAHIDIDREEVHLKKVAKQISTLDSGALVL